MWHMHVYTCSAWPQVAINGTIAAELSVELNYKRSALGSRLQAKHVDSVQFYLASSNCLSVMREHVIDKTLSAGFVALGELVDSLN